MRDLDYENRRWLAEKLAASPRGTKGEVAKAMGKKPDAVTRIINLSGKGETRNISLPELHALAKFFNDTPPGLASARDVPPPERRARDIVKVPVMDRMPASKLKKAAAEGDKNVQSLALTDLGRGDFFALTVKGDSMDRIAPEGANIIVNRADRALVAGKPFLVSDRGDISFRIWKPDPARFAPFSFNPVHEPIYLKNKDQAERMVVGRVVRIVIDI
jgi:SOS-response transcriptional repressor LexA